MALSDYPPSPLITLILPPPSRKSLPKPRMSETELKPVAEELPNLSNYVIDVEDVGPIAVFVEGDLEKMRVSSNIFMTVHGVGTSYQHMARFNQEADMVEVAQRSLFLHIALPGQEAGADDLDTFASLDSIGLGLVNILDTLRISRVLVLGDGAGANIALRFAAAHPSRVHGAVLVNPSAAKTSAKDNWAKAKRLVMKKNTNMTEELNMRNVEKYAMANKARSDITTKLANVACDMLVVTGGKTRMVEAGETVHREADTGLCSIIKMEEVEQPMVEARDKLADAVVLFAQGLGLVPNARRKTSRNLSNSSRTNSSQGSEEGIVVSMVGKHRKISMEQADMPNIR